MTRLAFLLVATVVSLSTAVVAATFQVSEVKFSIVTAGGAQKDHSLTYPKPLTATLELAPQDVLKFAYKVADGKGETVRPHQSMVVFKNKDREFSDEIMVTAPIKATGKGRFSFEIAKADVRFRYAPSTYKMELLVGGGETEPLKYYLGEIAMSIPSANAPTRPSKVEYTSRPEIHHQFREEQKLINRAFSWLFTLLVLSPWAVLGLLWLQLGINFEPAKALLSQPVDLVMAGVFFGSLVGIEYVFYSYWTHVTIFPVLQYLGVLSVIAAASGRSVLSTVQARRLKQSGAGGK